MIAYPGCRLPHAGRALVNVGSYKDQYTDLPPNVIAESWFPQPSVIPQVDVVIHTVATTRSRGIRSRSLRKAVRAPARSMKP